MNPATVEILLATWNGASWLDEQLESLFAQSEQGFRILVRDDGSTDRTRDVVMAWSRRHPGRIELLPEDRRRLGACGNFAELLRCSRGDYLLFCDQDDRWVPDKIAASLALARQLEAAGGPGTPVMVHADMRVVDSELRHLAPSFARHQGIRLGDARELRRVLVQNCVTGCTVLMNRALVERARPIPGEAVLHDYWIALVAAVFAQIGIIDRPLVEYRQHAANAVGSQGGLERLTSRLLAGRQAARASLVAKWRQAGAFQQRFAGDLTPHQSRLISAWASMGEASFLTRRVRMVRYHLWMRGLGRKIGTLVTA